MAEVNNREYTEREWFRIVGWSAVPEEYKYVPSSDNRVSEDVSDEHEKETQ